MVSQPSHLVYISPGSHDVCALYMIGLPDQVVEIEFTDFTIGCEDGGLLAVRTNWGTRDVGSSLGDHQKMLAQR